MARNARTAYVDSQSATKPTKKRKWTQRRVGSLSAESVQNKMRRLNPFPNHNLNQQRHEQYQAVNVPHSVIGNSQIPNTPLFHKHCDLRRQSTGTLDFEHDDINGLGIKCRFAMTDGIDPQSVPSLSDQFTKLKQGLHEMQQKAFEVRAQINRLNEENNTLKRTLSLKNAVSNKHCGGNKGNHSQQRNAQKKKAKDISSVLEDVDSWLCGGDNKEELADQTGGGWIS